MNHDHIARTLARVLERENHPTPFLLASLAGCSQLEAAGTMRRAHMAPILTESGSWAAGPETIDWLISIVVERMALLRKTA